VTLAPLLDAAVIRFHAAFAFAAIALGAVQLRAPKGKGTHRHRTNGWVRALLVIEVAGTSDGS
jgi:uncharacterized membrane protein